MKTTLHLCLSIRGALSEKDSVLKHFFLNEKGLPLSANEAREYLYDCLAEGKSVLPFGEPCEGFDYQKGCPGHETQDASGSF